VNFLVIGALAIAALGLLPIIAHLLQRGSRNAIGFPLVRLVLPTPNLSSRHGRIQDRLLLCLRGALIVILALLGAIPLVRCDRPVLTRQQGASVALAIILDDSASMRAQLPDGTERFFRAKKGAAQVISQLHEGDLIALVLAGHPARLVIGATSQLRMVNDLCLKTPVSDRSTDLAGAVDLAENALRNLPQADRRVVILSDMSQPLPRASIPQWMPNPELALPIRNCGIVTASRRGSQVAVELACTDEAAAIDRRVVLKNRVGGQSMSTETLPSAKPISVSKKVQTISFDSVPSAATLDAHIEGLDANIHDDVAPVFSGAEGTVVATLADYTTARAATGGPPLIEQALLAFGGDLVLRPWTTLPDDVRAYHDVSVLVLDDPPALGPEVRTALQKWLERGGLAFAWLGPRAVGDQLGTSLSPFLEGRARWESSSFAGLDPDSLKWLGVTAPTFSELHAQGRLALDEALPPASTVRARWSDFRAALLERAVGRGIVWTAGLPVSSEVSDIGLRPGFLALVAHIIETTRQRGLSPIVSVGHAWKFDFNENVRVEDPTGALMSPSTPLQLASIETWYVPTLSGLHKITRDKQIEYRLAHVESQEITDTPQVARAAPLSRGVAPQARLDLSPPLTLALVVIAILELLLSGWPSRSASEKRPQGARRSMPSLKDSS
jgi:hypothetical protein